MKERWFNYRPLCLIFGFLLLGSVFAFFTPKHTILGICVMIAVIIALLLLAIFKKKPQYVLVPVISFVFGICIFYLAISSFNKGINYTPELIQARICNITKEYDGCIVVEMDSCVFNEKKVNGKIKVSIYDDSGLFENIEVGCIIRFRPEKFNKSDLMYYETPNSNLYIKNLKYSATTFMENIEFIEKDRTFAEIVRDKIKKNLSYGLTNENTEIAYSALFGDKDLLSDKQYSAYKLSGVAHLLAVSGLHVGIIVGIFNWFFKKLGVKKWWKFAIISIFLLFYMYLSGFAVSIIRASIMSIILLIAGILRKEYDPFNAISVAGIVIFLINPLCVFDVAFLLSFSCVIGITMLHNPIKKALTKTHINEKIINAMAMSLSTTIAIVIIMAYFFKTLNIISIIANIILIPIFTIAFQIVFIISILSLLVPYLCYVLYPINYIFNFINLIATVLGNLSISNFNTIEFNFIAILVYFTLLLLIGRFCTAKYQYKLLTLLPIVALLFYCLL